MPKLYLYAACISASFTILLTAAAAQDAALLKQAQEIFQPLSEDLASAGLLTTRERIELGRSLFFDPRLTIDANMSCSSCHQPAFYGTDALPRAIGVKQRPHPRNAPTVLNTGALQIVHWRGDRESLEDQVAKAVTSPITSGQPDEKAITDRLSRVSGYASLFAAAFPNEPRPMTIQNIANAISAYERTLLTPRLSRRQSGGLVSGCAGRLGEVHQHGLRGVPQRCRRWRRHVSEIRRGGRLLESDRQRPHRQGSS